MQVTINDKVYNVAEMSQEAQVLIQKCINMETQIEALSIAKQAYNNALVKVVNSNKPVENDTENPEDNSANSE